MAIVNELLELGMRSETQIWIISMATITARTPAVSSKVFAVTEQIFTKLTLAPVPNFMGIRKTAWLLIPDHGPTDQIST